MKNSKVKISANEVNRFAYCPYQWYYGRIYGQKTLKEKYQALDYRMGNQEGNFKKGLYFHKHYYEHYRMKRRIEIGILLFFIVLLLGSLMRWFM